MKERIDDSLDFPDFAGLEDGDDFDFENFNLDDDNYDFDDDVFRKIKERYFTINKAVRKGIYDLISK